MSEKRPGPFMAMAAAAAAAARGRGREWRGGGRRPPIERCGKRRGQRAPPSFATRSWGATNDRRGGSFRRGKGDEISPACTSKLAMNKY